MHKYTYKCIHLRTCIYINNTWTLERKFLKLKKSKKDDRLARIKEYRAKNSQSSGEREEYSETGSKADIAKPIKSYAIESNSC